MFTGFNLSLAAPALASLARGVRARTPPRADHGQSVKAELARLLDPAGTFDAGRMSSAWFSDIACDVFLSHAHADAALARDLAQFLHDRFAIRTFIDADVWGSIADLQRRIDEHVRGRRSSSTYPEVLASSANVHMILMGALTKMMDRCECLVFLNSPRSVPVVEAARAGGTSSTYSPWIYGEILMSSLLRRRPPERPVVKRGFALEAYREPLFRYELPLEHLCPLDGGHLEAWKNATEADSRHHALDWLYRTHTPEYLT
jgi:hypothetical protein